MKDYAFKVPSQSFEGEGPVVGIRQFLFKKGLLAAGKIPTKWIRHINLGTTIATNALLERKGCKSAIVLTKGFRDLLKIRHQARPNIFDLSCQRHPPLPAYHLDLDERVYLCDTREDL